MNFRWGSQGNSWRWTSRSSHVNYRLFEFVPIYPAEPARPPVKFFMMRGGDAFGKVIAPWRADNHQPAENYQHQKHLNRQQHIEYHLLPIPFTQRTSARKEHKPNENWSFLLGFEAEFAKEENFFLTRVGVEYGYELPKKWEIFGTFSYDFKWNAYDSWGIGLGIAKNFGRK